MGSDLLGLGHDESFDCNLLSIYAMAWISIVVMDSRMEREQLKTAVSVQRARYSTLSNTAVGFGEAIATATAALALDGFSLAVFLLGWCAS